MFITTHAALGALVGAAVPNRFLSFALGFISHFLVDRIPHGDEHMLDGYKSGDKVKRAVAYVTIDSVIAMYVSLVILSNAPTELHSAMKWGLIGSILPDLLVGIYELTKVKPFFERFTAWHHKNHHHVIGKYRHGKDIPFKWGLGYQIIASIILVKIAVF
jgi:hypothetical protein